MRWRGKTVPLPPHFCTNPMDLLNLPEASMQTFTFHGWLVVEIFTDDGLVGIGNAALAPQVTKQVIDLYLKPLLIGKDPWDIEFLWQHMYRKTMAFGRRGIGMVAISAVDIAGTWVNRRNSLLPAAWRGPSRAFRFMPAGLQRRVERSCRRGEALQGRGLQVRNSIRLGTNRRRGRHARTNLVRSVRETVGDGIDGWPTLTWAGRSTTPSGCCPFNPLTCGGWKNP
jgi:hypothetical protein